MKKLLISIILMTSALLALACGTPAPLVPAPRTTPEVTTPVMPSKLAPTPTPSRPPPSTTTVTSHSYFPERDQFVFRMTDAKGNPVDPGSKGIPATYINMDIRSDFLDSLGPRQLKIYRFELKVMDKSSQVNLLIPTEVAGEIKLVSGSEYRINYQVLHGFPTAYGLIITHERELIFAGVSGPLKINDSFTTPIVKIEQTDVLKDRYIEGGAGSPYERMTNTEITFSIDGKSSTLHQGESSIIGNYEVRLLVARETKYKKAGVLDAGVNDISYTISKNQ